jgi:hypothetical protein
MEPIVENIDNWKWKYPIIEIKPVQPVQPAQHLA